jgi:diguanylate cyclase (GGDEF)-like protein
MVFRHIGAGSDRGARLRPEISLFAGAFVLVAMIMGVNVATLANMRENARQSAESDLAGASNVVSEHADAAFRAVDVVLSSFAEKFAREGGETSTDPLAREAMHNLLKERLAGLPQVSGFTLVDANGRIVASSLDMRTDRVNVSDRPYFKALKDDPALETTISPPLTSKFTGARIVLLARRLPSPDGAFRGLMVSSLWQSYFDAYYDSVISVDDMRVSLMRDDGVTLAQHPDAEALPKSQAELKMAASKIAATDWGALRPGETARAKSPHGEIQLISARRLPDFPIVALVQRPESSVFREWSKMAWLLTLISIFNAVLVVGLSLVIARRWRGQAVLLAQLAASETFARQKSQQFETTLANLPQGLCMFDQDMRVVVANEQYARLYDLSPQEVAPGTPLADLVDLRVARGIYASGRDRPELSCASESGGFLHYLSSGRIIAVNRYAMPGGGWVSQHEDVTVAHKAMERVNFLARHDSLTHLVNRAQLIESLTENLERLRRGVGCGVCVFLLDLDMFKAVNDSLGHGVGDSLLKQVGERLRSAMRSIDVVARLGGDEFAILFMLDEQGKRDGARIVAERLLTVIGAPYAIDQHKVAVGASIGIAAAPEDGLDVEGLISKADLALYKAKAGGRNAFRFYDATLESEARQRRNLHLDLHAAIEGEQFELHYQPIVAAATREVVCVEALVRWRHPRDGLIGPDRFIPIAEETGLIAPLGEWILSRACRDALSWPDSVNVAVNISPVQFKKGNLLESIESVLAETGLPAGRLDVEITENVFMKDSAENLAILRGIKQLGVAISLDDFGSGYSSLGYIRAFPLDRIKIDRSFIAEALQNRECAAIVSTIVTLARYLDIATVAEGVETDEQQQFLRAAGCTYFQGYLFGRPMPATEIFARLAGEAKKAS